MLKRSFALCFLFTISLSLYAQKPSGEISEGVYVADSESRPSTSEGR